MNCQERVEQGLELVRSAAINLENFLSAMPFVRAHPMIQVVKQQLDWAEDTLAGRVAEEQLELFPTEDCFHG